MSTGLFTHPACLKHENGPYHPESPDRLRAILAELKKSDYKNLQRFDAPEATREQLARVHDADYIEKIFARIPKEGYAQLDPDTAVSSGSGEAALRAAGAVIAAIDHVITGKITNAFCAVRPPGHHAERATAMGFCLFNNIAIGAAHARKAHNVKRIGIIDFDVHHGNGTQEWAEKQDDVLFISSHQFPLWPGTGTAQERGLKNNIINIPLHADSGGEAFRAAMQKIALPALTNFKPDLLMISAGFDAHKDDPLAGLRLEATDFGWVTDELVKIAKNLCQGRIVSTLEGGYDLKALAISTGSHIKALLAG